STARTKSGLYQRLKIVVQDQPNLLRCGSKPLRVLLSDDNGHIQGPAAANDDRDLIRQLRKFSDPGTKSLLNIDDHQGHLRTVQCFWVRHRYLSEGFLISFYSLLLSASARFLSMRSRFSRISFL